MGPRLQRAVIRRSSVNVYFFHLLKPVIAVVIVPDLIEKGLSLECTSYALHCSIKGCADYGVM